MPFTLTHVIAIIPARKMPVLSRLPFSALAIGSMIPDTPIFFSFASTYTITHSLTGIFTACLPLGLLMYAIFQLLVRKPLLEIIPVAIAGKLGMRKPHTPFYVLGVIVALVLGAATHVFWDSFTHGGGWGTGLLPALSQTYDAFGMRITGYRLIQHGSSVVFLPVLAWLLYRWAGQHAPHTYRQELTLSPFLKLMLFALVFAAPAIYALGEAWLATRSMYYGIGIAARNYGTYLATTTLVGAISISLMMFRKRQKQRI